MVLRFGSVSSIAVIISLVGSCGDEGVQEPEFTGILKGATVSAGLPISRASTHAEDLCGAFSENLKRTVPEVAAIRYCQHDAYVEAALDGASAEGAVRACEDAQSSCEANELVLYSLCPMVLYDANTCSETLAVADACFSDLVEVLNDGLWNMPCSEFAALGETLSPIPESCLPLTENCSASVRALRPWPP